MVNDDDDLSSKRDQSPFSFADDRSYRDENNETLEIDSSQPEQPVFSSQIPASARRDRELGKMNSSKSKKRRSRRSPEASQEIPPPSSQDFEPPFVKHGSNGIEEEEDDEDTVAQIKGDPSVEDEPGPVIEDEEFGAEILEKAKRERRQRKELKKARKAEKMRRSQLKADPDAIDEATGSQDTSQVNGASPEMPRANGFVAVNHQVPATSGAVEASKPSKRRKRLPAASPVAEEPTQDNENGVSSNPILLTSSANDSTVPISSPLKRKGRSSSDKKQRKKQKQQMENVEEEDEGAAELSTPFADAAQDIYAQRQSEVQSSPSAARLQRRSQSRANSAEAEQSDDNIAERMQPDQVSENAEEEVAPQTMDVDEDNDAELPANNHDDEPNAVDDAVDIETEDHLGSDDLGVAEPMEIDHDPSENGLKGDAAPTPTSKKTASGSSNGSALRKYGHQSSTGRKRHAKAPFSEAGRGEESNRQAFEELPSASPTVNAAKRRRIQEDDDAASGPSSVTKAKSNKKRGGSQAPRKVQDPRKGEEVTGVFSEFELRNIDRALKQWQEDHDLTDFKRNELVHKNPQSAEAREAYCGEMWDAIQAVVPGRKRQKIISQCRRKYHNFSARGAWTPEQHEELVELYNQHGPKYRMIADTIGRFAEDVRDRIRNYVVCGDSQKTATWDAQEELKLANIIQRALDEIRTSKSLTMPEHSSKKAEDLIDWQGIKAAMDRREDGDVDLNESMAQLIQNAREEAMRIPAHDLSKIAKRIKDTKATMHNRIPWSRVHAEGVGAKYSRPALMVAWCRLRLLVPDWEDTDPSDIATAVRTKYRVEKDLQLPTDINMDQEYLGLEYMIGMLLSSKSRAQSRRKSRSAHLARKGSSIQNGDGQEQAADDNASEAEAQASDDDIGVGPSSTARIPNDREIEESELEEEAPPADSSKKATKAKGKGKEKASKAAPSPPTKTSKGRAKGKGKAPLSASMVEDEEQSSDTDAEDVEDIPARRV
ncbi:myb-like DNA-binding domain-containing protein [Apiospora kogelbergensis]|uniref:Myb-like DNA-binding domain-containing protein n=1 Tax=Apiospora kogelbergensis TaxID=1337665 RepID=A0AAW0Q582_9PEZI